MLLVDELDRADDDFEAFLFEMLAESSVTIPEIGTIRARSPPAVILTSNRTRDLHDALKRRCLYHWIDYPSPEREVEIVRRRVPGTAKELATEAAEAVRRLRRQRRAEAARHRGDDRLGRGAGAARGRSPRSPRQPSATLGLGAEIP